MKRFTLVLLLLCLLVLPVAAQETAEPERNVSRAPGYCGEEITWTFDKETGVLTISGNGAMDDFPEDPPWSIYKTEITKVVFAGNIDYIGAYSFADYDAITSVQVSPILREIGKRAFYKCDGLAELTLPDTFRCFGPESLMYCTGLESIHCLGPMPSFRDSCLWETYVDIYYPANSPWPEEPVTQVVQAFRECFTIGPEPEGAAQMPAPAPTLPTQATQPETTEPSTQAPTQPTTAPPSTEPPTQPQTTEPAPTQPSLTDPTEPPQIPTRPQVPEQDKGEPGNGWIGIAIISLVISALGLGGLIFARPKKPKKGRGKFSR